MRIVCTVCQKPYTTHEVGTALLETAGIECRPYRLWAADILVCRCGRQIVRTGQIPTAYDEQAGFQAEALARNGVRIDYDHEFPK